MGFLDKAKAFMGGKGMADVVISDIEGQPAASASMPVSDSVVKGTMWVKAKENCELLATKYELSLRYYKDGQEFNSWLASDLYPDPNPNVSYSDDFPKFPMKMAPGQDLRMPFSVGDVDILKAAAASNITDVNGAAAAGVIKLVVKCIADVKGSPFDPSSEVLVALTPAP